MYFLTLQSSYRLLSFNNKVSYHKEFKFVLAMISINSIPLNTVLLNQECVHWLVDDHFEILCWH